MMRVPPNRNAFMAWMLALAVSAVALVWISTPTYAANGSVAYTYDALGRVTTASYDTGVCIIYTYDANGNRLSETINVTTTGAAGVWGCFNWNASSGAKCGSSIMSNTAHSLRRTLFFLMIFCSTVGLGVLSGTGLGRAQASPD